MFDKIENFIYQQIRIADFLNVSVLTLANHFSPGSVEVVYTDGNQGYFDYIRKWAEAQLGFSIAPMVTPERQDDSMDFAP